MADSEEIRLREIMLLSPGRITYADCVYGSPAETGRPKVPDVSRAAQPSSVSERRHVFSNMGGGVRRSCIRLNMDESFTKPCEYLTCGVCGTSVHSAFVSILTKV